MMIAQRLYESGFITYMRTDSVNLSDLALGTAKETIKNTFGERYYQFRRYHTKSKGAQEAHEAIRPTYISHEEIEGSAQEKRLYELIRKRAIACQLADAELERTTVSISVNLGMVFLPPPASRAGLVIVLLGAQPAQLVAALHGGGYRHGQLRFPVGHLRRLGHDDAGDTVFTHSVRLLSLDSGTIIYDSGKIVKRFS